MALNKRKITLCWPNYIGEAALSGGSWEADLPLAHIQNAVFAVRARSTDLSSTSTRLDIALPRLRPVGAVAIAAHNLSSTAQWRIRVYADSAGTELLYDSASLPAWPALYQSTDLEWEYDNYWLGTLGEEDRKDFTPLAYHVFNAQIGRTISIEIDDANNSDGYIEIGRVLSANVWQPTYNAAYGIQYGHDIDTEFEVAGDPQRTSYADPALPKRTVSVAFEHLDEGEAIQRMLGLQRDLGLHRELLYLPELTESPDTWRRTFVGRLAQTDPIANPYHATYTHTLSLQEIL